MKYKVISIGFLSMLMLNCYGQENKTTNTQYKISPIHMLSRWAKDVNPNNALKEYPRPQFQRKQWQNLNGLWEYSITDSSASIPEKFDGTILVPYPIESALSGVKKKLLPDQLLWYKKVIERPNKNASDRILINFDAVDWKATVYINRKKVGEHTGGYQNFTFDITDYIHSGKNEVLIKVYDPSDQGPNPHGKQVLNPSNIYYTPSSGIWQTVWLETVSPTHISHLKSTPDIDNGVLNLSVSTIGKIENTRFEIITSAQGKTINVTQIPVTQNKENSIIKIPNARLWSPDDPFLYDLTIKLIKSNKVIDVVSSYFGMRKIDIQKDEKGADRIFLNNKYTYNLGILDQGFWPEGLYTAPTDEALSFDIKTIKSLGFNTIRKHIKVEPERWYYHADKIGILVWQDFVNPPHGLPISSKPIFEKEIQETMDQLYNHPSIITWVLFNERWGSYDQERLTRWVKKYDSTRLVNGHSGELLYVDNELREPSANPWVGSDMTDVHSYPHPRNAPPQPNKARVVGEFGGVGVPIPYHEWDDTQGWGYVQVTPTELKNKYIEMTQELKKLETEGLSASIYTQPFDVEGEENGLLTYDREMIKIPVSDLRSINREMVPQTKGFLLDSNFNIAANIDINDTDNRYEELLRLYKEGNMDSSFLRRLTLMSFRKRDKQNISAVGNSYIGMLKCPFSNDNLSFIRKITQTSNDKGFWIFFKQHEKVDSILGENAALAKVKAIIAKEEIGLIEGKIPNWDSIQKNVSIKYGAIGEEVVIGRKMLYYGVLSNIKDWKKYAKYYMLYFEKALSRTEYDINAVSWLIFENINDPKVLEFAIKIMKYAIDKWDKSPEALDTYANLLHKTDKTAEAIKWEQKAVNLKKGAPDEKLFTDALQKMKSGLPTWPQNN